MSGSALLWWALCSLGLIYFVTESAFFAPVRVRIARRSDFFAMLLYCPACSGFWLGLALGIYGAWPEPLSMRVLESAIASMGLGALWGAFHFNAAWTAEAQARGEVPDDETETIEDGPT